MDMQVKSLYWENVFSVIQRSYSIHEHIDFFTWLQDSVNDFIPHDLLLAGWGDFSNKELVPTFNYDVTSNVSGINTQVISNAPEEIDTLLLYLHECWVKNDRRWLTINNLNQHGLNADSHTNSIFFNGIKQLNSLLIYGVSDVRGHNECLYVFFSREKVFVVQDFVMGLLMPHIDNILRKIQYLEPKPVANTLVITSAELSSREMEIIHWIKSGKTNHEIGMILQISQNTVKSHLKRIFNKLNVCKRAQAVAILSAQ